MTSPTIRLHEKIKLPDTPEGATTFILQTLNDVVTVPRERSKPNYIDRLVDVVRSLLEASRLDKKYRFNHHEYLDALAGQIQSYIDEVMYAKGQRPKLQLPPLSRLQRVYQDVHTKHRSVEPEEIEVQVDVAPNAFSNYAKEQEKLRIGIKPFAIRKVPIIPMATGLRLDRLERQGLKATEESGYIVLHSQIVIGINTNQLRGGATSFDEAERVADIISTTKGIHLNPVTHHLVARDGAVWYWYATDRNINSIMRASGGQLQDGSWGFAF